jgi:hypothetical protein
MTSVGLTLSSRLSQTKFFIFSLEMSKLNKYTFKDCDPNEFGPFGSLLSDLDGVCATTPGAAWRRVAVAPALHGSNSHGDRRRGVLF